MKSKPGRRVMLLLIAGWAVVLMLGPVQAEAAKKISGSVGKGGKNSIRGILPELGDIQFTKLKWGIKEITVAGTRARAGTVLEEIEVEKEVDRTSVPLVQACSGGASFPEVVIEWNFGTGEEHSAYLELRLYSVKVTSYSVNGSGLDDGSVPTETLSLNFDKISWRVVDRNGTDQSVSLVCDEEGICEEE